MTSASDRLHVLHLVEDFLPPNELSGGVRVAVYHEVLELARRARVTVLAPRIVLPPLRRYAEARSLAALNARASTRAHDPPGVRVLRPRYFHVPLLWPLTEPLQLVLIGWFALALQSGPVHVLHGHRLYPMGMVAVLLGRSMGRGSVVTSHGSGLHTTALSGSWRGRWWTRWVLKAANRIVVVSRELARIAHQLGVGEDRCRYIPNGVDLDRFRPGDQAKARAALDLPPDAYVVVDLAYFLPVKGHQVLVEAFRELASRRERALLLLAGDGPLLPEIRRQVSEAGLEGKVRFLGPVDHEGAPSLLDAADCLVLPSWNEGMPLVVLEAMASGKPVVATAVGGTRELITSEQHGILVPPGDPSALAAGLEQAMERSWRPETLRARAAEFAWPRIAERLHDLYREIIPDGPPRGERSGRPETDGEPSPRRSVPR